MDSQDATQQQAALAQGTEPHSEGAPEGTPQPLASNPSPGTATPCASGAFELNCFQKFAAAFHKAIEQHDEAEDGDQKYLHVAMRLSEPMPAALQEAWAAGPACLQVPDSYTAGDAMALACCQAMGTFVPRHVYRKAYKKDLTDVGDPLQSLSTKGDYKIKMKEGELLRDIVYQSQDSEPDLGTPQNPLQLWISIQPHALGVIHNACGYNVKQTGAGARINSIRGTKVQIKVPTSSVTSLSRRTRRTDGGTTQPRPPPQPSPPMALPAPTTTATPAAPFPPSTDLSSQGAVQPLLALPSNLGPTLDILPPNLLPTLDALQSGSGATVDLFTMAALELSRLQADNNNNHNNHNNHCISNTNIVSPPPLPDSQVAQAPTQHAGSAPTPEVVMAEAQPPNPVPAAPPDPALPTQAALGVDTAGAAPAHSAGAPAASALEVSVKEQPASPAAAPLQPADTPAATEATAEPPKQPCSTDAPLPNATIPTVPDSAPAPPAPPATDAQPPSQMVPTANNAPAPDTALASSQLVPDFALFNQAPLPGLPGQTDLSLNQDFNFNAIPQSLLGGFSMQALGLPESQPMQVPGLEALTAELLASVVAGLPGGSSAGFGAGLNGALGLGLGLGGLGAFGSPGLGFGLGTGFSVPPSLDNTPVPSSGGPARKRQRVTPHGSGNRASIAQGAVGSVDLGGGTGNGALGQGQRIGKRAAGCVDGGAALQGNGLDQDTKESDMGEDPSGQMGQPMRPPSGQGPREGMARSNGGAGDDAEVEDIAATLMQVRAGRAPARQPGQRRARVKYSDEEIHAILDGLLKLTEQQRESAWATIKREAGLVLSRRSNVDLKDKWRNLQLQWYKNELSPELAAKVERVKNKTDWPGCWPVDKVW